MSVHTMSKAIIIGVLCVGLTGCAILDRDRAAREAEEAADKEGRITMVLGDDTLQPDASLVSEVITLPPARELTDGWPQAGSRASKAVGHIGVAAALDVAWRADVGSGSDKRSALTTPAVASTDTVFTIDSRQLIVATDAATGNRRWSQSLESSNRRDATGIGSGLGLEGNTLV
ncbi:MAG: hypothetical protein AAFO74_16955, partial [Pseudomonadota bacterium]